MTTPTQPPEIRCAHDEQVCLDELKPNPRNPNTHPPEQIKALAKIIAHQGWRAPIVVSNLSGFIVAGHGRYEAALILGVESVPVNFQNFETEADEWAHMIADNRLAELADMNQSALTDLLIEMDTGAMDLTLTGFDENALAAMVNEFGDNDLIDAEPQIDKAAELQEKWGTAEGQIWILGDHYLACGDCTDELVCNSVLQGKKAAMVFTDPPYNIDYGNIKHPKFKERQIENDSMSSDDWEKFCQSIADTISKATDGCIYVCHAPNQDGRAIASILDANFHCSTTIIWNKDVFTLGRGKYQNKYEPIWFGWAESGKEFSDRRDLVNVWDIPRPKASELHPTIKPLEVVATALSHASKQGDIVFDPFLGSGTTLMACENLGRKCRGIELAPEYVAVTLERWHQATGKHPEKIDEQA